MNYGKVIAPGFSHLSPGGVPKNEHYQGLSDRFSSPTTQNLKKTENFGAKLSGKFYQHWWSLSDRRWVALLDWVLLHCPY
jgi:hypothetical protein